MRAPPFIILWMVFILTPLAFADEDSLNAIQAPLPSAHSKLKPKPAGPSFLETKSAIGFTRNTLTEGLTIGQTSTDNLTQLPVVLGEALYHFNDLGVADRNGHLALGIQGRYAFHRPLAGVSFSNAWRWGAELNWLYAMSFENRFFLSPFIGFESEKFYQGTLYNSPINYNGPLYARSNTATWLKLGVRFKSYLFRSWQVVSLNYLRSLSATATFPTDGTTLKAVLTGFDLDLRFGIYRRAFFEVGFRHFSGNGDLSLSGSQTLFALGWTFY